MIRWTTAMAVAVLALPSATSAQVPPPSDLDRALAEELSSFPAKIGVYVHDLATGEEAGHLADEAFNSMSVIKIPMLILAFQLADSGELDLDERVRIEASDLRAGSGMLYNFDAGLEVTIRDLLTQMIITSDNTATDMVLPRIGGVDAVNAWLEQGGYRQTRMLASTLDFFRTMYGSITPSAEDLSPEDLFMMALYGVHISDRWNTPENQALVGRLMEEQDLDAAQALGERWSTDRDYWLGVTTPREMGALLTGIVTSELTSEASSAQMQRIMRHQRVGGKRIPHFLDYGAVAHKTGDAPPAIANDVGIIYARTGPIVVAFFTAQHTGAYVELETHIGRVARMIVDHFEAAAPDEDRR